MPPSRTCTLARPASARASSAWAARAPERQTSTTSSSRWLTQLVAVLAQQVQRHVVGAGDVRGLELGGGAHVEQARRVAGRPVDAPSGSARSRCGPQSGVLADGQGAPPGVAGEGTVRQRPGVVERVVDGDHLVAAGLEQRRDGGGAVAGAAVHPDRRAPVRRRAARAGRAAGCAPRRRCATRRHSWSPHVEHDRAPEGSLARAAARSGNVGDRATRSASAAGPLLGLPVASAAGRSMPIRTSSRWASATCSGVSPSRVIGAPQAISQPS